MSVRARAWLQTRLQRWLFQMKTAEPGEVVLRQRRVFIMPTRAGMGLLLTLAVMFVGSLNYNLNLGYALTFLLAACGLVAIHLTFRNLAYLSLSAARANPVFAGQEAQFDLNLINRKNLDRYAIWLGFFDPGNERAYPQQARDVAAQATDTVSLYVAAPRRGWLPAPRVRLQSRFPLGLLRAWSYWSPDARVLVYPQAEELAPPLPVGTNLDQQRPGQGGQDDFGGIRSYRAGDAMRHLAWRQIAKLDANQSGQLLTKYYDGGTDSRLALDFSALPQHLDLEQKLARMTRWVLQAEQLGLAYSFSLGETVYPSALGAMHQARCLAALALFALPAGEPALGASTAAAPEQRSRPRGGELRA